MRIRLLMLGKTRRPECRAMIDDYAARTRRYAELEISELRDTRKLKVEAGSAVVLLDAAGKQFTSPQFAKWVGELRDRGVRELVFLCGGAEGFPEEVRAKATQKVS